MAAYEVVKDDDIEDRLKEISGWTLSPERGLVRNFSFRGFNDGLEFVNRVAAIADSLDHHPDVFLSWGRVELSIITHCKNALTTRDFELARAIEAIV